MKHYNLFFIILLLHQSGTLCVIQEGELAVIKNYIKNGDLVFDIGANVGEWGKTVLQEHPKALIHAFEPIPDLYETLKEIDINHYYPHNIALSKDNGISTFFYYPDANELSSIHYRPIMQSFADDPINLTVITENLDHFCQSNNIFHINFIKIDTEGNEFNVLLGASHLLKNHAIDALQFEYGGTYLDAHITLKQVYSYLVSMGYKIYRIEQNCLTYIPGWNDVFEDNRYSNYLAVLSNV